MNTTPYGKKIIFSLPKAIQGWAYQEMEKKRESWEQVRFVYWMEEQGLKYTAIPNSTWTRSWMQKLKNHALGLRKGLPDLIIVIPPEKLDIASPRTIFIEMKRVKGGSVSKEQKEWIDMLNDSGIDTYVCKGADEAIKVVESYFSKNQ